MTVLVGSADLELDQLADYLKKASKIIAVDGGLNHLEALGVKPHIILGDLDSYKGSAPKEALILPKIKDFSDMEAALEFVGDERTYIFGATGGRLDHFLSVLGLIETRENIELIDGRNRLFYRKGNFILPKQEGYFSLFPQKGAEVTISGASYNLNRKKIVEKTSLLLSNSWLEDVSVGISEGWVLVVISQD